MKKLLATIILGLAVSSTFVSRIVRADDTTDPCTDTSSCISGYVVAY